MDYRKAYGLPERYFLSLGRMVEKKNLATLVEAYARFARASVEKHGAPSIEHGVRETADGEDAAAAKAEARLRETGLSQNCKLTTESRPLGLVFVGSGELEGALKERALALGLTVIDRTNWRAGESSGTRDSLPATCDEENRGAVYFYGFRQIEENPVFYALAEAFVLPSLKEEWGLVVNEAMASGLPVIVSRTAGCAEDLVPKALASEQVAGDGWRVAGKGSDDCRLTAGDSLEERSNGFVFDPKSSDALATALTRVAEMGDRRFEMGKRSREIVANFTCENFARQALRAAEAAGARATIRK